MSRESIVDAAFTFGLCLFLFSGKVVAQDFIPGAVKEITRDSEPTTCIKDQLSPACAFEAVLYCMVRQDQQMCTRAGVDADTICHPNWITKIRYAIEQVYGLDDIFIWAPTLVPLSNRHQHARIVHRVEVCVRDQPCGSPTIIDFEESDRRDGTWKVRSPHSAAIYEQQCYPSDT